MKKIKKLQLKKEAISNLNNSEMNNLKGGAETIDRTGCVTGASNACSYNVKTCITSPTETTWYM